MQLLLIEGAYRLMVEHFINWLLFNSVYCSFSNCRFLLFPSYITFPTVVEKVLYYCPIIFYDIFDISCSLLCRLCVRPHSSPFSCSIMYQFIDALVCAEVCVCVCVRVCVRARVCVCVCVLFYFSRFYSL